MAKGLRLLLVDDEEGIRKFLGMVITDFGYEVLTAENGSEALEVFRAQRPDIVLTDIKMPVMDGIELLRRIKDEDPDAEVVMISGHGDMDLAIQSLKLRAADFVTKPINDDILEASLDRVAEKIAMRRQLKEYTENLENLVREKTAQHQQLFDEAPCFISVQDADLGVVAANRRYVEAFGEDQGSFCWAPDAYTGQEGGCPVMDTFLDGDSREREAVFTARDGRRYIVLTRTAPIRNLSGEITAVMEMSTDITALRTMQDHLTSLGLMLGSVSHGVKGMLTVLDGGLYRLKSGIAKDDMTRIRGGAETVEDVAGRIKRMVLDILYYAKSRDLAWDEVNPADVARSVGETVAPRAEQAGVAFQTNFEGLDGTLEADLSSLSPALVNLLENAVDACRDDTAKDKQHAVSLKAWGDAEHVWFAISDNGMGMDTATRERIFTLFFSCKGRKGTGLGLFIASQVVEQHGGTIEVASEPGQGATFTVRLPRVLPEDRKVCTDTAQ